MNDQFFPLPLHRTPSIAVLLSARSRFTGSLLLAASFLMGQSSECAKLGCEHSLRDSFLHIAQPGVCPNFLRMSCEIFKFRGTGRSSTGKNGVSSRLRIGHIRQDTSQNSTGAHAELDRVQIFQRCLFRHRSHCPSSDQKAISLSCHIMFFCMGNVFPSMCQGATYLSVMTPPGTFPTTLNITASPNSKSTPRC